MRLLVARSLRPLCAGLLTPHLALIYVAAQFCTQTAHAEPPAELKKWLVPQPWQRDVDQPIVSLGADGDFDDRHIFAPAVAEENGRFLLWYSGSRGTPGNRVFRLGLATGTDGKRFEKHSGNPVLSFADNAHSVLTPAVLRRGDGSVLREEGKLRLYFSSAMLGKSGLHTLHQSRSEDGIHWDDPSPALADMVYCPTVLKTDRGYEMWFSDVSRRPWVIRHATSTDGSAWTISSRPAVVLSQEWEGEVLVYPTVLHIDGVYLMWYGSYDNAVRRETTAIGFAASLDGEHWFKHPNNPVLRPDPARSWESNYVGSGCIMRLADGTFRYWYASRKAPPFLNLYFAINTARWQGPKDASLAATPIRLPPQQGDEGTFPSADVPKASSSEVLEVIDENNLIVRAWYAPTVPAEDTTFIDLWIRGVPTKDLTVAAPFKSTHRFRTAGNQLIDTTCGKRSFTVLEAIK